MNTATLNIKVSPRRMISLPEAAEYCGLTTKRFSVECSVAPLEMPNGRKLYDLHDLDIWIEGLKGELPRGHDEIIERLGK